jgi:hypothetical protein
MRPSHVAYTVTHDANGGPDSRAIWREVGALWPQKNGHGWLLVIHPQTAISGRIVITERKERADNPRDNGEPGDMP